MVAGNRVAGTIEIAGVGQERTIVKDREGLIRSLEVVGGTVTAPVRLSFEFGEGGFGPCSLAGRHGICCSGNPLAAVSMGRVGPSSEGEGIVDATAEVDPDRLRLPVFI